MFPESGYMVRNGQKCQNIGIYFQNWEKKYFDGEIWKIGENVTFFTFENISFSFSPYRTKSEFQWISNHFRRVESG